MSGDLQLGVFVRGFEKLAMDFDRQVAQLIAGEHGLADFPRSGRGSVLLVRRRPVAPARLHGQSLRVRQLHLDLVVLPVRFKILGIEAQIINVLRRVGQAIEFCQEIVLADGGASRAMRQIVQDHPLGKILEIIVLDDEHLGLLVRQMAAGNIAGRVDGEDAARVEGVDDDARAGGAIDGCGEVPLQLVWKIHAGRHQNYHPITGHGREQSHDVVERAEDVDGFAPSFIGDFAESVLGDTGGGGRGETSQVEAIYGNADLHRQSLLVVAIHPLVRREEGGGREGLVRRHHGHDLHQRLAELCQVAGEFERHSAGEREQRHAFLRAYALFDVLQGRDAGVHQVFHLEMDVVENIGGEAGGNHQLGAGGGWFAGDLLLGGRLKGRFGDSAALDGELRNVLRLAVVGKLKVLFMEGADGVPLLVANYHRNAHQIHARLKGGRFVAGGNFAGLSLRGQGCGEQEKGPRAHDALLPRETRRRGFLTVG